jgi:serine phosphatase RsbU (regulator of sigma subunit)/PAS domain-containing protein
MNSDAILDALFAHAPIGVGYWDADFRYQRVNAELAAMNGLPPEAHLGRRPSELLPELGPRVEAIFARVVESGMPLRDIDMAGRTPASPDDRQWLASYFPVSDGGVMALVVEAVRGARFVDAELRALYSALPVGVAFLSPELRYLRVNETLARLNGRPVEEHLGASLEDILGEAAGLVRPALERVADARESLQFEADVPLPAEPGKVARLEAVYFPVVGPDDGLLGVGGVVADVTRRHALEREQARLLEEAERGRKRIAFLADAGARMAASVEWEATLRAVVRSAVPDIADWTSLTILEADGTPRVAGVAHSDPERERLAMELVERYPTPEDQNQSLVAMRTGETILLEDIGHEQLAAAAVDAEHLRLLESLDIRHAVITPLISPAGPLGALTFVLGESGRRIEPEDLTLIRSLATRAALHLQNARLYQERSHVAETLQASLRPRALPATPGVDIAAAYRPAGDETGAGGDFYDVFTTGDGALTAIVGDVSGKGPEAAAITATARHTLHAISMLDEAPGVNLRCLNAALRSDAVNRFCTAFYVGIRPGRGGLELRYASAGHPPPLVVRADGRIEELEGGRGPLAGATADAGYPEGTDHLAPGEVLLLYTDGVTEISTNDMRRGEAELRATLESLRGISAAEVVAAIEERVVALQAGRPRDDIALVALRVPPRP